MEKIAVLGAGSWGTALAALLSRKGLPVYFWARQTSFAKEIKADRENKKYLPGVIFPDHLIVTDDLEEAVTGARLVLFVVPTKGIRETAQRARPYLADNAVLVSAAKGIEKESLFLMSQVLREELPDQREQVVVLSGPNHAEEVGKGIPSATVVACENLSVAEYVQSILMTSAFRVYTNADILGVEIAGALKNIIAIDAGASDGLGFGDNTKAALLTRGLAEIARVGIAMGANPLTFAGLAGIGDLIATCTSPHSRNRRVGIELAQGKKLQEILSGMNMVAEGVSTTEVAVKLAEKYSVEMPITVETYDVLFRDKSPRDAVMNLMLRGPRTEIEEIGSIRKHMEYPQGT